MGFQTDIFLIVVLMQIRYVQDHIDPSSTWNE